MIRVTQNLGRCAFENPTIQLDCIFTEFSPDFRQVFGGHKTYFDEADIVRRQRRGCPAIDSGERHRNKSYLRRTKGDLRERLSSFSPSLRDLGWLE